MPPPTSNFLRTGQPDPRLAQSASTPFDATARQVLDQQVVDVQTLLALLQANGVIGSYVQVDPAAPSEVQRGDVLCRSAFLTRRTAVVAAATDLALAGGAVLGVALDAAARGTRCPYAALGPIPPEVTGLAQNVGFPFLARVSSVGRAEAVSSYGQSDTPLGGVDSTGWLTLTPGGIAPDLSVGIFRGALTTSDATPQTILTVPFSDNALLTGTFNTVAATFGVGYFTGSAFGFTALTSAGVLSTPGTPLTVSNTSYVGPQPSFALSYATDVLSVRVTGIAATVIAWRARFDVVDLLL